MVHSTVASQPMLGEGLTSITLVVAELNTLAPGDQFAYWSRGLFAASRAH